MDSGLPPGELIGTVKQIFRYPVKGMRGESIPETDLWWTGLRGDRRFAFMNSEDNRSGFPWLTGRRGAKLVKYIARWSGTEIDGPPDIIRVTTPDGTEYPLDDPGLLSDLDEIFRRRPQLVRFSRGCFDAMPVSVISTRTVESIGAAVGASLDVRRFRPNLVLKINESMEGTEDDWLGRILRFGASESGPGVRLNRKNVRCVMITIDPETGKKTPEILKYVAGAREECAGVYGSTESPGAIRVGEPVYLL